MVERDERKMKMKKLLTVLTVACVTALAAHASSVKWSMNPGTDYTGWKGYLVSNTSFDSLAATLATVLAADAAPKTWVDAVNPIAATGDINTRGKATGTITDVGAASTYTLVVFDGDIATGSKYAVFDTFNVSDYAYEGAQTPKTMEFKGLKGSGTLAAETGGGDDPGPGPDDPGPENPPTPGPGGDGDVPEPTSGILLMIGGAALALRRRR